MNDVRGYKVFNPDWTCREFQYKVGDTYEENVIPSVCDKGFHFCKEAKDCFNYYSFDPNNKVAEIIALGEVSEEGDKCCTNKIQIVREISWQEVLTLINIGKACTGLCNSGNRNSGNWNSGNSNSGDCNSGDCNSGYSNSGNSNSGNWNSGDWNSGDCNSGDWNKTNHSSGVFNTNQQPMMIFNKPTDMTFEQWRNSDAYRLLSEVNFRPTEWIYSINMTDEEKQAHPDWKICEGYLKHLDTTDCCKDWWNSLSMDQKCIIQNIPNFDPEIFEEITGIGI